MRYLAASKALGWAVGFLAVCMLAVACGPTGPGPGPGRGAAGPQATAASLAQGLRPILGDLARSIAAAESGLAQPSPGRVTIGLWQLDNQAGADPNRFARFEQQFAQTLDELGRRYGLVFVDSAALRRYTLQGSVVSLDEADHDRWLVRMAVTRGSDVVWEDALTAIAPPSP